MGSGIRSSSGSSLRAVSCARSGWRSRTEIEYEPFLSFVSAASCIAPPYCSVCPLASSSRQSIESSGASYSCSCSDCTRASTGCSLASPSGATSKLYCSSIEWICSPGASAAARSSASLGGNTSSSALPAVIVDEDGRSARSAAVSSASGASLSVRSGAPTSIRAKASALPMRVVGACMARPRAPYEWNSTSASRVAGAGLASQDSCMQSSSVAPPRTGSCTTSSESSRS
mmetsp:Transcript_17016/g.56390  ORF Transcript_17016/g.56390 Transcript_17016/m.56390 type:complete len:230 (+) Transcript_17016:428-1117(+)